LHPDGLLAMFNGLKQEGITDTEINRMAKENPARLLGLE
jgi:predicted metal-dependent phosphotriesterase family hydrolase